MAFEDITTGGNTFRVSDPGANNKFLQPCLLVAGETENVKGTFGSTTSLVTTGINSLASSTTVGYISAEVDISTTAADDVQVFAEFQMTTAGTPTSTVDVSVVWSLDGTSYTGDVSSYSGSAASYTLGGAGSPNVTWLFSVKPHANTNVYGGGGSLRAALGFVPPFFAIVTLNQSGIALHSSGSEVAYRVRY